MSLNRQFVSQGVAYTYCPACNSIIAVEAANPDLIVTDVEVAKRAIDGVRGQWASGGPPTEAIVAALKEVDHD